MNYVDVNYTLEELEQFRDEDGFINLDLLGIDFIQSDAREKMGTIEKDKYWAKLKDGTKLLLKSEDLFDGKETASPYAELICEELAKQVGVECAHCDLIKFNGKKGVFSKSILKEGEQLFSLNSILKIQSDPNDMFSDVTNLVDVIRSLPEFLKNEDQQKDNSYQVVYDMLKQIILQMHILNSDGHTENMSVILDADGNIRMSPLYDNEKSLLLDTELETLEKLAFSESSIFDIQKNIYPKIAFLPEGVDPNDVVGEDIWKCTYDTINMNTDADEVVDFIYDCQDLLDIDMAVKRVEDRIKAPLPFEIERCAKTSFLARKKEIDEVMISGFKFMSKENKDIEQQ